MSTDRVAPSRMKLLIGSGTSRGNLIRKFLIKNYSISLRVSVFFDDSSFHICEKEAGIESSIFCR